MRQLKIEEIPLFTVLGLKAICGANRDVVSGYNKLRKDEVKQSLNNRINEGHTIIIPPCITNEPKFYRSYIK